MCVYVCVCVCACDLFCECMCVCVRITCAQVSLSRVAACWAGGLLHRNSFVRGGVAVWLAQLLEHGRGHYDWVNRRLDSSVDMHAAKWGCWWNRDVVAAVAARPDLEVKSQHRFLFGTTLYVVASKRLARAAEEGVPAEA